MDMEIYFTFPRRHKMHKFELSRIKVAALFFILAHVRAVLSCTIGIQFIIFDKLKRS